MSRPFDFSLFMRDEFSRYNSNYASENVEIIGKSKIDLERGGVVLFLHFGSFFLSGLSLIHQLGVRYTAIASSRNFTILDTIERNIWNNVHQEINQLYSQPLFKTDKSNPREIISFLKSGGFLGAALDAAEIGKKHKFHPFEFLHNQVYLQTGPARIAKFAQVPIYGMSITYNKLKDNHSLQISGPHDQIKIHEAIQIVLSEMEETISRNMDQMFHNIFYLFSKNNLRDLMIEAKPTPLTKVKSLAPLPKIKSKPPSNFSPRYESEITGWHPHRGFVYDLIRELQPKIIVELGVHYGDSYFTFCQACEELELDTKLYGIDHWKGDEQAGFFGKEVFDEVSSYEHEFYSQNSTLIKANFEDALCKFRDSSIDLLHIDGSHDYENIWKDFRNWLSKMRKGGKILVHDILVDREDFGVKKFWEEISQFYRTESHLEEFGLGIITC